MGLHGSGVGVEECTTKVVISGSLTNVAAMVMPAQSGIKDRNRAYGPAQLNAPLWSLASGQDPCIMTR